MVHFSNRIKQYNQWAKVEEPPVMWLSGLHIPEAYLTALVQISCRKKQWALDKSTLYTVVTQHRNPDFCKKKPEHGCYITGLYLEGASWDIEKGILTRQLYFLIYLDPRNLFARCPSSRWFQPRPASSRSKITWRPLSTWLRAGRMQWQSDRCSWLTWRLPNIPLTGSFKVWHLCWMSTIDHHLVNSIEIKYIESIGNSSIALIHHFGGYPRKTNLSCIFTSIKLLILLSSNPWSLQTWRTKVN